MSGGFANGGSHDLMVGLEMIRDATAPAVVAAVPALNTDQSPERFTRVVYTIRILIATLPATQGKRDRFALPRAVRCPPCPSLTCAPGWLPRPPPPPRA